MESKKRKLGRELGGDATPAGDAELDAGAANAYLLHAQNRALATNLHRYTTRISELESELAATELARRSADDCASVIGRKVSQFQSDLLLAFEHIRADLKPRKGGDGAPPTGTADGSNSDAPTLVPCCDQAATQRVIVPSPLPCYRSQTATLMRRSRDWRPRMRATRWRPHARLPSSQSPWPVAQPRRRRAPPPPRPLCHFILPPPAVLAQLLHHRHRQQRRRWGHPCPRMPAP